MRRKASWVEALWLLGCYLLSFVLYGVLAGYWLFWQGTLDIQIHNTYFVVSHLQAILVLFWVVALVVTSARAIAAPLRTRYTWLVLLMLGTPLVLVILLIVLIKKRL